MNKSILEIVSFIKNGNVTRVDTEMYIDNTLYKVTAYKVTDKLIRFDFKEVK